MSSGWLSRTLLHLMMSELADASGNSSPPPTPYISETAFSHRFQKVYTSPPPPNGTKFWRIGPKFQNPPGKVPKPTALAQTKCPREISEDGLQQEQGVYEHSNVLRSGHH